MLSALSLFKKRGNANLGEWQAEAALTSALPGHQPSPPVLDTALPMGVTTAPWFCFFPLPPWEQQHILETALLTPSHSG